MNECENTSVSNENSTETSQIETRDELAEISIEKKKSIITYDKIDYFTNYHLLRRQFLGCVYSMGRA